MKSLQDTSIKKIFVLIKNNFVKKDTLKVSGILKGDGKGGVTAAVAGTDYAKASHTHTQSQISDFQVFHVGTTAPTNTKLLWIDTANGLKYYNGSAWVTVPVAYK